MEIVYFGSLKTDYIRQGVERFEKWLRPYTKLKIRNLPSGGDVNRMEKGRILENEAKFLFGYLNKESYVVLLSEHAKEMNSVDFSRFIDKKTVYGKDIVFVIGGYLGFSDLVAERANAKLSLSKMTYTHEMALLLLIEQIYRSFKIMRGEKYHY